MIVDKESPERRVNVVLLQVAADVHDVERTRWTRQKVRPYQFAGRPRYRGAGAEHHAVASIELAHQGWQPNPCFDAPAAVTSTLEAIAECHDKRIGFSHPSSQLPNVLARQACGFLCLGDAPRARGDHELVLPA